MDVLFEAHDQAELDIELQLQTPLIGINNRNLRTFKTSLDTTLDLPARVPDVKRVVTGSGLLSRDDVQRTRGHKVDAAQATERGSGGKEWSRSWRSAGVR